MKLKFKTQAYQTDAVQAVIDCFEGQNPAMPEATSYRIDPGKATKGQTIGTTLSNPSNESVEDGIGFKNAQLTLTDAQLLHNIQKVQRKQNLLTSDALDGFFTLNAKHEQQPADSAVPKSVTVEDVISSYGSVRTADVFFDIEEARKEVWYSSTVEQQISMKTASLAAKARLKIA
jgi:hypothetical protein